MSSLTSDRTAGKELTMQVLLPLFAQCEKFILDTTCTLNPLVNSFCNAHSPPMLQGFCGLKFIPESHALYCF